MNDHFTLHAGRSRRRPDRYRPAGHPGRRHVHTLDPLVGTVHHADVLLGGGLVVGVGPGLITAAEDDGAIVVRTGTEPVRITTSDVLDFATLSGARTLGVDPVTGSLTPGKQADLIVVDAEDLNTMPLHDPIGTLVLRRRPQQHHLRLCRRATAQVGPPTRRRRHSSRPTRPGARLRRVDRHAPDRTRPTGGEHSMTARPGTLVVRDAIVHPTPSCTTRGDIVVTDGTVTHVGTRRRPAQPDAVTIDAAGASAVPLLVESAVHARPPHHRNVDDLAPGNRAAFAVIRGSVRGDRIRHMLVVSPRDLLAVVVGKQVEALHGAPTRPSADRGHAWTGAWTDTNRGMTQYLTPYGRYSETRGGRADAYTGCYWVHEDRITYVDDQGFWAFGQQVNGILHHAGYVLHRTADGDPHRGGDSAAPHARRLTPDAATRVSATALFRSGGLPVITCGPGSSICGPAGDPGTAAHRQATRTGRSGSGLEQF